MAHFEREQRAHECGYDIKVCSDPERVWYPQRRVDYVVRETMAANAFYDQIHENEPYHDGTFSTWSPKRSPSHPYHARDGVTIFVSETEDTSEDIFSRKGVPPKPAEDVEST